jgi:Do/DeqQ family serine protease
VKVDDKDRLAILSAFQETNRLISQSLVASVVTVNVVEVVQQNNAAGPNMFENFPGWPFGQTPQESAPKEYKQQGQGSGAVIARNGDKYFVVTNNHVAGGADSIEVVLSDGSTHEASLVGKDERTDLAIISFESANEIPVATLGDSDTLRVGDFVFAVGNPLGYDFSVTSGIVSALGRSAAGTDIADYTDYIQTDASINQGNSGGPLVNLNGEIIGINTWIASQTGGSVGIGFAIPINNIKASITSLISNGKIEYGWLGVSIMMPDNDSIKGTLKDMKLPSNKGAFVVNMSRNSPAEKGGLLPGDFIVEVDGAAILSPDALTKIIGRTKPGTAISLTYYRYGEKRTAKITITVRANEENVSLGSQYWPGVFVRVLDAQLRKDLKIDSKVNGLIVTEVIGDSNAQKAGFAAGDVITKVNNQNVTNIMDFFKLLNDSGKEELTFRVVREGRELLLGMVK